MQQPEPKEIAKVMLFIEGFKNAEEIGRRIVELFDLSKFVTRAFLKKIHSNFPLFLANFYRLNDITIGACES